ncbi:hypothetical protein OS493_012260 [Desmophyllum pertusum]|uniref:Uncharacterized protein n=1 Tax=Desmophyllum pertusum TaxID=174260 RepID=A0A9X0D3H7_9CNID|nr:hypothetical protein OS493_012260 [Desmophyllum pertusum]
MKMLSKLNEEILGLLEKEKDIEHKIADGNKFRRDIRKGIQKIEDYLSTDYRKYRATVRGLDELEEKEQKVLREIWNRVEDTIVFKFDALIERSEHLELTKRNLLKIIAKFFDSLGC